MAKTRIESKSRPAKRPMAEANYVTDGSGFTYTKILARKPKTDKKGYPGKAGLPAPVLVKGTGTAPAAQAQSQSHNTGTAVFHKMVSGDTIFSIAQGWGLDVHDVLAANQVSDPPTHEDLPIGFLVYCPGSGEPTDVNTVAEIKRYLDLQGTSYTESLSKGALLALI